MRHHWPYNKIITKTTADHGEKTSGQNAAPAPRVVCKHLALSRLYVLFNSRIKVDKGKFIGTRQCPSRYKEEDLEDILEEKKDEQGICGRGYETQTMT
jgi:hypothetical protein